MRKEIFIKRNPDFPIDKGFFQVIAFDVDGTLAETDEYYIDAVFRVIRPVLFWLSERSVKKVIRKCVMTAETLAGLLYFFADRLQIDFLFSKLHNRMAGKGSEYRYALMENAVPVLLRLSEKYRLAVVTAGGEKSTDAFLKRIGIADLFEVVVTSQTCRYTKPSGMPLRYVAQQMNVPADRCLMVGDTIFDLGTAKHAHASFIAVRSGLDSEWLLRLFGAKIILDSVADLPDILL